MICFYRTCGGQNPLPLQKPFGFICKTDQDFMRYWFNFFFYQCFLSRTLTGHRRAVEVRGSSFISSTTSTRSRIFRHLFATFYVRWLSHIFNRIVCIYQTATRWDLSLYAINYHLIHVSFCLFAWWFDLILCYSDLRRETGGLDLASTNTLVLQANWITKILLKSYCNRGKFWKLLAACFKITQNDKIFS